MKGTRSCIMLLGACVIAAACGESPTTAREAATIEPSRIIPGAASPGASISPAVRLTDAQGQPVSGAPVTFEVTGGGGSVSTASVNTAANGIATLPSWTLGPGLVVNTLVARHEALPPVTFTVSGCAAYCIDVRFVGNVSASLRDAFENARRRWEQVITGDLANVNLAIPASACKDEEGVALVDHPAIDEQVDDLVVYAQFDSIDGPGKVVGVAGPCYIRNTSRLPVFGIMRFDIEDMEKAEDEGYLADVILHEIGHTFGLPTLWSDSVIDRFLLEGKGTNDPYFIGSRAASEFTLAGGLLINGEGVPVENIGGPGTRDSHWRESVLSNELMTGTISGGGNPLSAITIGSLQDIGYQVSFTAADAYTVPGGGVSTAAHAQRMPMIEGRMPPPRVVF